MLKFILLGILLAFTDTQSNYNDNWEISLYNADTEEYEILSFDMSVGYASCDSTTILIIIGELNSGRKGIVLPLNTVSTPLADPPPPPPTVTGYVVQPVNG